jgi:hypothetical protein
MSRTLSIIGIALTIAYLGVLWFLFDGRLVEIMLMEPNEIGDLLAGIFGPLAILWLILVFSTGRRAAAEHQSFRVAGGRIEEIRRTTGSVGGGIAEAA